MFKKTKCQMKAQLKCPHCGKKIEVDAKIIQVVDHQSFLKIKEKDKLLQDLKVKLDDARHRADVSSQQLSGEVQELFLEDQLKRSFPLDSICEIKKGTNGADCLQQIRNSSGEVVGKILFESKRTKTFSSHWLTKLKQDNLRSKADLLVLVTKAMPSNLEARFGLVNGVWVVGLNDAIALVTVLRHALFRLYEVRCTQESKASKMSFVYDFLTSEEFKQKVEYMLSRFSALREGLNSEKTRTLKAWKDREQILEEIISSSTDLWSTLEQSVGITGSNVKLLQLPPQQD